MILENLIFILIFYQDCNLICNFFLFIFFKTLYIHYYATKTSNKSLYSVQCRAHYIQKVISYIASYFS